MRLYRAMMLNNEKFVARPALHYLSNSIIELIFVICEVKGAEIEASAIESDNPISACFKAPQSLAPSPHIDTFLPIFWYKEIALILSFGFALAKTVVLNKIYSSMLLSFSTSRSKIWFNAGPVIHSWTDWSFNDWINLCLSLSIFVKAPSSISELEILESADGLILGCVSYFKAAFFLDFNWGNYSPAFL